MTTIDSHDDECKHGIFPPTSCSLCNGHDARRAAAADELAPEFPARYISLLACGHFSTVGEPIRAIGDGRYVCAEHAHDEQGRR